MKATFRRSPAIVIGCAVLMMTALAFAAVMRAAPSSASTVSVMIEHYAFSPSSIDVKVGDTVTWTNMDDAPHTVTSTSGPAKIDSPQLNKGDTFSYTFTHAGTYQYDCAVHPDMKGTVVVSDNGGSAGSGSGSGSGSSGGSGAGGSGSGSGGSGSGSGSGGSGSGGTGGGQPSSGGNPSSSPPPSGGTGGPGAPAPSSCSGQPLAAAMAEPFVMHFDHAHLEESPSQQAGDLTNPDQYVRTHTVLFEQILAPGVAAGMASVTGVEPFVAHVDHAHLAESPAQQAADLLNLSAYVNTHTVLLEDMTAPATGAVAGSGGC